MEKAEIISYLKEFGLNTYEAKAYLSLLKLGKSTATEISKESQVPQQRIYDSLTGLEKKGFVQAVNKKPKLFIPIPVKEALINRIYQLKVEFEKKEKFLRSLVEEIVQELENVESEKEEQSGILLIEGEDSIVSTALQLLSSAERSIKVAGIRPLFTFGCRGNLEKYIKSKVDFIAIGKFDTPCKEEIEKIGGRYYEKELKCPYLLIIDDQKLLFLYSKTRGIYSKNPSVVTPFLAYFKNLTK